MAGIALALHITRSITDRQTNAGNPVHIPSLGFLGLSLGSRQVLGNCPALLQGFLGSCRAAAQLPGGPGDLSSCVAVLQHVALARLQDVELCHAATMAWMRRDPWDWLVMAGDFLDLDFRCASWSVVMFEMIQNG